MKKSAKEILEHEEDLRKSAKNADEAKQIDDVFEDLRKVAEDAGSTKFIILGKHLDDFGKLRSVAKYEDEIRKLNYEDARFLMMKVKYCQEVFLKIVKFQLNLVMML